MNLQELLKKRRQVQVKKMSRYAKYVFNDHFVIVMVFLLGALAYQYSEFLKTLTGEWKTGKAAAAFLLAAGLFIGKLSVLVEKADQVFLAGLEKEWQAYFRQSRKKSMLFPAFLLLLLSGLAMPLLFIGKQIAMLDFIPVFLTAAVLKWTELTIQELETRIRSEKAVRVWKGVLAVSAFLFFLIGFFVNVWAALVLAVVFALAQEKWFRKNERGRFPLIAWEETIAREENRQARLNRIINLFTDAPQSKSRHQRKKYLDGIVRFFSGKNNPYIFLYSRAFFRGDSYSGLFLRLILIGGLVLLYTPLPLLNILLGFLFLYLIGFQLVPLYFQVNGNTMTRLYPQPGARKQDGFKKFLENLLAVAGLLLALASGWGSGWKTGLAALFFNFLFINIFVHFYVSKRMKKRAATAF